MAETRKRRSRDPVATRAAILEASCTLLAKDGPEGISLSEVAVLAGVSRGTAYQHFETRENLITATTEWVSSKMFLAVFGDEAAIEDRPVGLVDVAALTDRLTNFSMENPELCRIWLLQLLSLPDPKLDPFWRQYEGSLARFADTDLAQEGIDTEVLSIINLAGAFLWPIWARSHAHGEDERRMLTRRFAQETLRLSMYGSLQSNRFPKIAERLGRTQSDLVKRRAVGR